MLYRGKEWVGRAVCFMTRPLPVVEEGSNVDNHDEESVSNAQAIIDKWVKRKNDPTFLDTGVDDDWESDWGDVEDVVEEECIDEPDDGSDDTDLYRDGIGEDVPRFYTGREDIEDDETEIREAASLSLQELIATEPVSPMYRGKSYTQFLPTVTQLMGYKEDDPTKYRGRRTPPLDFKGLEDKIPGLGKKTIGADFARYGDDRTCFAFVYGIHVVDMWSFEKKDQVEAADLLMTGIREFQPDEVILDITGGWGAGVYDILKHMQVQRVTRLTGVAFNQQARRKKWGALNARAEMYLILADRFRKGLITLPQDPDLLEELAYIRFEYHGDSSLIAIQVKDSCKKELGRSPDRADAVALATYSKPTVKVY